MPANNTAATAINIGTLTGYTPYTTSQDAWNGSGVDDLWYSYTPVAGDDVLEVYAYGNGTTVQTSLTIRSGPPPAATELANSHSSLSRPVQQDIVTDVTPGEDVFFKIAVSNVNPAVMHLRVARGQKQAIAPLDLFINDSSPGYPGITMARATAIPKRYELNYPAGEGQQVLQNGVVAVIDAFTALGPVLYDVSTTGFTVRATPTMPDTHYTEGLASNQIDTFWAFKRIGGSFAVSVDQNGVVGAPLDLSSGSIREGTPQSDNSALYCIEGTTIQKITNPGGVKTLFVTVTSACPNILMMTDDTLLVAVNNAGTREIRQYNLSGSLINTVTTAVAVNFERIFADAEDPLYFWVWWQTSTLNRFQKYQVSDGAIIEDLSRMKFIESVSQTTVLADETVFSGADFSCVPIVLRGASVTTRHFTLRRERRFVLPSSPDNKFMQIPTLELLMRTGIGLTPGDAADPPVLGSDPQVMMRISKDGGQTWLPERWVSAGTIGKYLTRARWLQATGNYRNAVCEITVSDPVDWQFLAMDGTPKEGTS